MWLLKVLRKWSNINIYAALAVIKSKATILADPLRLIWWRSFSRGSLTNFPV
jgi:hypothetical protein